MDAKRQDLTNSIGLLILRIGFGGYMLTHGWGKFLQLLRGDFAFADPLGMSSIVGEPFAQGASLFLAAGAEFFCAILVVFGAATRFAAAPIVFTMLVAAFVVHGSDPWTMGPGASKEPALLFASAFLALIFTGAGKFSVDGIVWPWLRQWRRNRKQ